MALRIFFLSLLAFLCPLANAGPVRKLGLYTNYGDTAQIFDDNVQTSGLTNRVGLFLKQTLDSCRARATKDGKSPSSIGSAAGHWLEWSLLVALKEQKLTPAYWQAEFVVVPKNYNDVLLWSKEYGPIILSCKTSLRERYKQADLEAVALRQHFPSAKFFLVTLDEDKKHVANIRKKIAAKELLALQEIYDETNADDLFAFLKTLTLTPAPDKALRSGKIITDKN
jgi:hypothetical protein